MVAIEPDSPVLPGWKKYEKKIAVVFTGTIHSGLRSHTRDLPSMDVAPELNLLALKSAVRPIKQVEIKDINILITVENHTQDGKFKTDEICLLISTLDFHPNLLTKDNYLKTRYIFKKEDGVLGWCNFDQIKLLYLNGENTPSNLGDYFSQTGNNLSELRQIIKDSADSARW